MNYYQARQIDPTVERDDAGKWRWTVMNDGLVHAVGACRNCAGHDTAEAAERHQYDHEMEHEVREYTFSNQKLKCAICDAWTQGGLEVGRGIPIQHVLCDEHRTVDYLTQLRPFVGGRSVVSSY